MAVSREKEMAEVTMDGAYATWLKFNTMRIAYAALTTAQWNSLAAASNLTGVTQAQGVAFVQNREDEAMIDLTKTVNIWRLTP